MKILLLNQSFYPDVVSTAQHLADLAAALAARGHEVTVIASRRAYDNPGQLFCKTESWRGVRVLRAGSTGFGKTARWRRVLDFASFFLLCTLRVRSVPRQDLVIALTSPPLISLLGLCLARAWNSRFIYWIMDLNPDAAVAAGWLRPGSFTTRLLEWTSRLTLRGADRVIALDRFMYARVIDKGVSSERIAVLPPWSHDAEVRFNGIGRQNFRKRNDLEGKFVVMFSGNHSPCHPLSTVFEAASNLAHQKDIVFCFIGGGTEFRRIESQAFQSPNAEQRARPNIRCFPYQPLEHLAASLSAADLHLAVLGDPFVGLVHPCKIYNLLRVGAPVVYIGPPISPISDVLAQANGQLLCTQVRHGDAQGLVNQILKIRDARSPVPRRIDLGVCKRFSREEILPRFISHLEAGVSSLPSASTVANPVKCLL